MKAEKTVTHIAGKPLKEICEMPLMAMTKFIREHHDRRWSVPNGKPTSYKVKVDASIETVIHVQATSDEMAIDYAKREFESSLEGELSDADIDFNSTDIVGHEV